ncbi:S53 family peptidase [Aspergillus mulundensis]|uniref:tripeptidyl-peptidase II n=1 Tax=Aspergillus mulundensis TaxID=1810919 RepID=A0A3D8SK79_9EURO|nr:hypothetical protein DSM5745_03387 [Aspergillus mulundensis]RDW86745.1 hypothetical protein DSM5745_03387 [Aspergillus mulundensis]
MHINVQSEPRVTPFHKSRFRYSNDSTSDAFRTCPSTEVPTCRIHQYPGTSAEASLDIQYAISLAYDTFATYNTTSGRAPYLPETIGTDKGESVNAQYLEQPQYLLGLLDEELPAVLSTSYHEEEQSIPESYGEATCSLFAQLGARGVSVIFGSGDDGVGRPCLANDNTNRTRFQTIFPASCPLPLHDNGFLESIGSQRDGMYNPHGRAVPDVAAQANNYIIVDHGEISHIGDTSTATPVFAAIVSRLDAARLEDGKPRLSFLNPWLYSLNQAGLTDIVDGGSVGCLGDHGVKVPYASWNAMVKVAREL